MKYRDSGIPRRIRQYVLLKCYGKMKTFFLGHPVAPKKILKQNQDKIGALRSYNMSQISRFAC